MRVLIADDSVLILERLKEMLSLPQQVEIVGTYSNGPDTLNALRTLKPDLAIVDIKMPGLSGLQVLKAIRQENKTLVFIILTLFSSEFYREKAMQAGADYFFCKSDDLKKLARVMVEMVVKEDNDLKN